MLTGDLLGQSSKVQGGGWGIMESNHTESLGLHLWICVLLYRAQWALNNFYKERAEIQYGHGLGKWVGTPNTKLKCLKLSANLLARVKRNHFSSFFFLSVKNPWMEGCFYFIWFQEMIYSLCFSPFYLHFPLGRHSVACSGLQVLSVHGEMYVWDCWVCKTWN